MSIHPPLSNRPNSRIAPLGLATSRSRPAAGGVAVAKVFRCEVHSGGMDLPGGMVQWNRITDLDAERILMSIKVVCGCGFCTLLPSDWEGKRVKCKCGRTFIVGNPGAITQPPVEPPAVEHIPPPTPDHGSPVAIASVPQESSLPPSSVASEYVAVDPPAHLANTLHRERHVSRARHQIALACLAVMLALASLSAVVIVLRDHDWSLAALLSTEKQPELPATLPDVAGKSKPSSHVSAALTDQLPADADREAAGESGTESDDNTTTRLANLTDLASEDGLLLTGMFGDGSQRLGLNASQQETITGVVSRLKQNEQELKATKLTLEQWYAACRKLGDEMLAVLTDAQRQQFQVILERNEMQRVHLVEYSARVLPELAVAQMPWSVQTAGRSFRVIATSSFTAAARDLGCRASEPTGMLATFAAAGAGDAPHKLTVWDLTKDHQSGSVDVTSPVAESASVLSRDGRHWVLVRKKENAAEIVEVWSTEAGKLVDSKELPARSGGQYTVRDCVAHRVVALCGQGYWVWDFESGDAREIGFPESRPDASPGLAISADGNYLVVAHPHVTASPPDEYCFVEVCIYRLDTGELLGNQVIHKAYLRSSIGAIALSQDGRELALLWDFGPANPTRRLVHMNAGNGKIIKTIEGLPPADQGYARQHQLADRDLIWLPENSGWLVNLQNVVDAETGAVLPLELPVKGSAGTGAGAASSEVVEAVPAGDGRLLLIIADRPASPDQKGTMRTQFVDLPKLGPFQ
jgi:hypothetical protein